MLTIIYTRERTPFRSPHIYQGEYGGDAMAPQVELQRIPDPADETDILREQLDYLIEHTARNAQCGCSACQRYLKVRSALLEIFGGPPRTNVQEIAPRLARRPSSGSRGSAQTRGCLTVLGNATARLRSRLSKPCDINATVTEPRPVSVRNPQSR